MTIHSNTSATFRDTVEECLKHFTDPTWLGEHSPLAAPYLLHHMLEATANDAAARGRALQRLFQQATSQLTGKYAERSQTLLREYYFRNRAVDAVCDEIGLGRDAFHTSRKRAIESLVEVLTQELQPALALETPPQVNTKLLDRAGLLEQTVSALVANQTVALLGSSGSGKTSLGAQVARQWAAGRVFWYTVQPGFTDYLDTFLFHLAHFLRRLGAPVLWQELTAAAGTLNLDVVSGVVRHALLQCGEAAPLLCLDEADCLVPAERGDHAQWLALLQAWRGVTPVLLMAQQGKLDADLYLTLTNLSSSAASQMIDEAKITLSLDEQQQLFAYTHGNPRLLQLFITLHSVGEPLPALLRQLSEMPSLEMLLGRILQRLSEVERSLLLELAILRNGAPRDAWPTGAPARALSLLENGHLLESDGRGKVWLLPTYAAILDAALPDEKRALLQAKAGRLWAERGQYTSAAHHFAQSDSPEEAIWLWRTHQQQEINQGQASRALHIFDHLTPETLSPPAMEQLTLLRATLARTIGNAAQAQTDLRSIVFKTPLLAIEAESLAGVIANDQGEFDVAEEHFRRGLRQAEPVLALQLVQMRKGLAWRYMGDKQLDAAWQQAQIAQYELENFLGNLQEEYCEYAQAESHYQQAVTLAQALNHSEGVGKTCGNLAGLYALQGKFSEAMRHWQIADQHNQQLGNSMVLAGSQLNLGFFHNLAGEQMLAIQAAQAALALLAERNITPSPRFDALAQQVMAEAHCELGNLNEAEALVKNVIIAEEISLLPDAYRTYSQLLLRRGQPVEALSFVQQAIALAQQNQDRYLEAYAWRVTGQIHQACSRQAEAQQAWQRANQLFSDLKLPNECEKTNRLIEN